MAEGRVTQAGLYIELEDQAVFTTQAGLYIELEDQSVFVTQAGLYVELVADDGVRSELLLPATFLGRRTRLIN